MGNTPEYEKALQRAMRLCSRMERSSGQMRSYLHRFGRLSGRAGVSVRELSREEVESIVEELKRGRFIDDSRFALAYIRDKRGRAKWGPVKIRAGLRMAGIDNSIVKQAFEKVGEESVSGNASYSDNLRSIIEVKFSSVSRNISLDTLSAADKRRMAAQLLRFAVSRGFEYADAVVEVNRVIAPGDE